MSINTELSLPQVALSNPSTITDTKGAVTRSKISFESLRSVKESLCNVAKQIKASQITRTATRVVSAVAALGLGIITGFAIAGIAANPAFWGIFGGSLAVGLAGSAACQSKKEFLNTLKFTALSFASGTGSGLIKGTFRATARLGLSVIEAGPMATAMYAGGAALYMGSSLTFFLNAQKWSE